MIKTNIYINAIGQNKYMYIVYIISTGYICIYNQPVEISFVQKLNIP